MKEDRVNSWSASNTELDVDLILALRRARSEILGEGLFSDPAWDMLLQLFAAKLRGSDVSLTDLVTDVPDSTRARWAGLLQERGLITCRADALIPSVLWIELSARGSMKMSELLCSLRH